MNPTPGTGTTYQPKNPVKLSPASVAAGMMQPSGESRVRPQVIQQISIEEAEADLDKLGVDDWVKKHYTQGDFNIQGMANVLLESTEDIYNRLHAYGFPLPDGTYTQDV